VLFKEDCSISAAIFPADRIKKMLSLSKIVPNILPSKENTNNKLGAIGDVIRTTPLIKRNKQEFPKCMLWWVTNSPEGFHLRWIEYCNLILNQ
jgi:hypothetical protein